MSLPALSAVRRRFPAAHIAVLARPWVEGLYRHEPFADEIIPYQPRSLADRFRAASALRQRKFDCAVLLQNAFDAALVTALSGIPRRIGYARDGRGWLLTDAIPRPRPGEIPRHESYYYLELLRRVGWVEALPPEPLIRLSGAAEARKAGLRLFEGRRIIGVSPGAAYGTAKRWWPERFAAAASALARDLHAEVALFGSAGERALCETVRGMIHTVPSNNYAGSIGLEEFIRRAAACLVYLTNDSGAMHIASALGVPTVAIFGATDAEATGPTGGNARVVYQPVECSPCLLRECPIDHRCMRAVEADRVVAVALELLQKKEGTHWIPEPKS